MTNTFFGGVGGEQQEINFNKKKGGGKWGKVKHYLCDEKGKGVLHPQKLNDVELMNSS